jgi:hypothetical protein
LVKREPDDNMRVDKNQLSSAQSSPEMAGATTSPLTAPLPPKIVDVVGALVSRDKLRYGFTIFRDHNGLALSLNFIHDRQTISFKKNCSHFLHPECSLIMVIIPLL